MEWLYGRQVARSLLMPGARRRVHRIVLTAATRDDLSRDVALDGLALKLADSHELEELVGAREHQGVALQVDNYPYVSPDELIKHDLVVVLDEVSDPRNLGAVARSALASGADAMVLPKHRSAAVTPAAVKASAGATEHLRIAHVTNVTTYLTELKKHGFWVYGAAGDAQTPYTGLDYAGKVALVFGSEGRGLRPLVARTCDVLAAIPMVGPVGSLNVSVAAALFLFEARRQRDP